MYLIIHLIFIKTSLLHQRIIHYPQKLNFPDYLNDQIP